MEVADNDGRVSAKIADLDPDMQMVSMIFGLEFRIVGNGGETFLRGNFEPTAFTNLWRRCPTEGNLGSQAAMFQSILSDLKWANSSASPFLSELKQEAKSGLLSVKFNVDGFTGDSKSNEFCRGRIVGTIGVSPSGEPKHFCLGRHFLAGRGGKIGHAVAQLDEKSRKIRIDLGNSLPVQTAGGGLVDLGVLSLKTTSKTPSDFGEIPYRDPNWYASTAGVVDLPLSRDMTESEMEDAKKNQLVFMLSSPGAAPASTLSETPNGLYVRADMPVFRLSADEIGHADFYATRFGAPEANSRILFFSDPNWTDSAVMTGNTVTFEPRVTTDESGRAKLKITAGDPGNPRVIIDGQTFGIRYALEETLSPPLNYPFNKFDCLTLLVWDKFSPDEPPTWYGCLEPIFKQYENLYPVMDRFLKLGNYDEVCAHHEILKLAFSLPVENPNSMPVTRDLSPAKRKTILAWLSSLGSDGKPLLGVKKPHAATLTSAARAKPSFLPLPQRRSAH